MTRPDNTTYEDHARKAFEEDPHYVATVARMGDRMPVVAEEDILAADGAKLLDKGAAIDSGLRDQLLRAKLMKPLDESLAIAGCITGRDLAAEISRLWDDCPYLCRLFPFAADRERAGTALAQLDLPPLLAFKLTVARQQRPGLFEHVLLVALICHYLAAHQGLDPRAAADLLLAALLHDLGELHTDPAVLEPGRRIAQAEMRYIYAHPITGYLIAKAVAPENPEVAKAVLQHQERLDGSGYPYGLRADATGTLARIVGVADVTASILARFGSTHRLSALMRLNRSKYDPAPIALLQQAFGGDEEEPAEDIVVVPQLKAVAKLLKHWGDFRASLAGPRGAHPPPELDFLFERMVNLNVMLLQFGFDPNSLQQLRALVAEDRAVAGELAVALNEVRWQFADLEREILRRKAAATKVLSADKSMFLDDWLADLRRYLEEAAAAPG